MHSRCAISLYRSIYRPYRLKYNVRILRFSRCSEFLSDISRSGCSYRTYFRPGLRLRPNNTSLLLAAVFSENSSSASTQRFPQRLQIYICMPRDRPTLDSLCLFTSIRALILLLYFTDGGPTRAHSDNSASSSESIALSATSAVVLRWRYISRYLKMPCISSVSNSRASAL